MKKILLASIFTFTSLSASADMLIGGDIEMNVWQQNQTVSNNGNGSSATFTFEGSIEHFIPLIPNIKFAQSAVNADDLEYTKQDYTLYYEFLDNDLASFDAGIGISKFNDGRLKVLGTWVDFAGYIPHVYVATEVGIVGTPLFIFAKGSGLAYGHNNMYDASFGVQYEIPMLAFDLEFQAGYRVQRFNFEDFDNVDINAETNGLFAGINIDF